MRIPTGRPLTSDEIHELATLGETCVTELTWDFLESTTTVVLKIMSLGVNFAKPGAKDETVIAEVKVPEVGSRWRRRREAPWDPVKGPGVGYTVIGVSNTANRNENHPPDVVYRGDNGNLWTCPLSKWPSNLVPEEAKPSRSFACPAVLGMPYEDPALKPWTVIGPGRCDSYISLAGLEPQNETQKVQAELDEFDIDALKKELEEAQVSAKDALAQLGRVQLQRELQQKEINQFKDICEVRRAQLEEARNELDRIHEALAAGGFRYDFTAKTSGYGDAIAEIKRLYEIAKTSAETERKHRALVDKIATTIGIYTDDETGVKRIVELQQRVVYLLARIETLRVVEQENSGLRTTLGMQAKRIIELEGEVREADGWRQEVARQLDEKQRDLDRALDERDDIRERLDGETTRSKDLTRAVDILRNGLMDKTKFEDNLAEELERFNRE